METRTLDIRACTCKGGGALWAFLSHVCELPRGGTLELLTDDPQAKTDIPEWVRHMGWRTLAQEAKGDELRFLLQRPWNARRAVVRRRRQGPR